MATSCGYARDVHALRIHVKGDVQNVGFRVYVQRRAAMRNITGEVWNTQEGNVEALAIAQTKEALDGLLDDLRRGPGRIESIESEEVREPLPRRTFEIGPTR